MTRTWSNGFFQDQQLLVRPFSSREGPFLAGATKGNDRWLLASAKHFPRIFPRETFLALPPLLRYPDPLQDGWVRCKETNAAGRRVGLSWGDGRLGVSDGYLDDYRRDLVWLAAVRTS
jgi:hypothetical protein